MTCPNAPRVTRQTIACPIIGVPKELSGLSLPTYEDILLCCLDEKYKRSLLFSPNNKKELGFLAIADCVATQVVGIYNKATIPTVTHTRVVQLIQSYYNSYIALKKSYNRDCEKDFYKKKIEAFIQNAKSKLFDIAACKCNIALTCTCGTVCKGNYPLSVACECDKTKRIPDIELKFMYDQRTTRKMAIGSLDLQETSKLRKREERRAQLLSQESLTTFEPSTPSTSKGAISDCNNEKKKIKTNLPDVECDVGVLLPSSSTQMRSTLTTTSLTSDRFGVSDRATAAIATAVLHDLGIICDENTTKVIDRNKIRREKKKIRKVITEEDNQMKEVNAIYFDGRKDKTMTQQKIGSKMYRRTIKEEHVSVISEPGGKYIGHVTPKKGTGSEIADSICEHLESKGFDMSAVEAVGCDGTATNTGWRNGVIHNIELKCRRSLQWFICLLHFNELPYRHLLEHLDGTTTGPASFSGPIGKQLPGCEKLPVVDFEPIQSEVIDITKSNLSKDQQYLLDIVRAVNTGICNPDLAAKDPGPISLSRWLTCANRVLRLYVSQPSPTIELQTLANYIVKTYAPVWFDIKKNWTVKDGPKHILKVVKTTRYLPESIKNIIDPVIQRNAFFCHPENIMLAMIMDKNPQIRELGYRRILKSRNEPLAEGFVRDFIIPSINFSANDYTELIDWSTCKLTPPPLLSKMSTEHIASLLKEKVLPEFNYLKFPCHTQAVERCVKLVTESAEKVCGQENRDGYIRATLKSRQLMPTFDFKSQFKGVPI